MKIIISALGTKGDIHPLIGLGKIFLEKNYEVVFLSNDYFEDSIKSEGINFHSTGTIDQYVKGHTPEMWKPEGSVEGVFLDYYLPSFEPSFTYVKQCHEDGINCIVITLTINNGARIAADIYNIPSVLITLSPSLIFSAVSPPAPLCWKYPKWIPSLCKEFLIKMHYKNKNKIFLNKKVTKMCNDLREKLNAPKIGHRNDKNEILNIGFFPEWFGQRPIDWPANIKQVGFPLFDYINEVARSDVDSFILKFGSPILFTTGTGLKNADDFFKECMEICNKLNLPGLLVGSDKRNDYSNIMHISYIDFEYVLPKCLAIVHHGGIGTVAQAIRAGVPQLIRPLKFDQPDNANRIHKLGLGTFVYPKHFDADHVAPILKDLIVNSPKVASLKVYAKDVKRSAALQAAFESIHEEIQKIS